jgi:hypothetical protein
VRGNDDHVDMLPLHHFHDVYRYVIANFDAGSRLYALGLKSCQALRQMTLCEYSCFLKEFAFRYEVRESRGGKKVESR